MSDRCGGLEASKSDQPCIYRCHAGLTDFSIPLVIAGHLVGFVMETCQHALDQLIIHSQPTHAVAVFDDDARSSGWRHQRLPDYKA
ncbi:PocR ligand-binding domain-containing protein, partial [Salmonella enterica subsp. enterica serovar Lubbock]|nr:PocR ligand-binding domain-containing protein [Salmonella enterica subsp. enterica serovar Lubbock]